MKSKHDKSKRTAGRRCSPSWSAFHRPAPPGAGQHAPVAKGLGRLALPVALEALALASFAHLVRARHRAHRDAGARSPRSAACVVLRHL